MTSSLLDGSGDTGLPIEDMADSGSQIFVAIGFMDYIRRRQARSPGEHGVVGIASSKKYVDVRTQFPGALGQRRTEHASGHHYIGKQQIDAIGSLQNA